MIFYTQDLAIRIEQAFVDSYYDLLTTIINKFPAMEGEYFEFENGIATYTKGGVSGTWVHGLGLTSEFKESDLNQIEDFYFDKGNKVKIQLSPMVSGQTIETLGKHGYQLVETYNALIKKIEPADKHLEINPVDYEIREALPSEEKVWSATMVNGFRDLFTDEEMKSNIWHATFRAESFLSHIAMTKDTIPQAMGCSMMSYNNGIGMFNSAATLPDFRRRGVQTGLIKSRIKKSAELGCEYVVLGAANDTSSLRNAQRCGMEVVNSRLVMVKSFPG